MINSAEAAVITGTTTTSGIVVLSLVQDAIPYISFIGIIAGTVLAVHGVYELIMRYVKVYRLHKGGAAIIIQKKDIEKEP